MNTLPKSVVLLTNRFSGIIVGSAADPTNEGPRDYDILIPFSQWRNASVLIPNSARVNSFGGWKFNEGEFEIDVWPGEIQDVISYHKCEYIWIPQLGKRFKLL